MINSIEHCSYTSSINQAARWNKWWAKNQFHNCSSHKKFTYLVCTNFQILLGGGSRKRKKTTHLRKARTGADLLNIYYWGLLLNSMSNYLIRQNCVSCMYKFCMQLTAAAAAAELPSRLERNHTLNFSHSSANPTKVRNQQLRSTVTQFNFRYTKKTGNHPPFLKTVEWHESTAKIWVQIVCNWSCERKSERMNEGWWWGRQIAVLGIFAVATCTMPHAHV